MEKITPAEQLAKLENKLRLLAVEFNNGSAAERSKLLSRMEALREQIRRAKLIVQNLDNQNNQTTTDDIITEPKSIVSPFGDVCSNSKGPVREYEFEMYQDETGKFYIVDGQIDELFPPRVFVRCFAILSLTIHE
jgi:hypothetical protein